MCGAICHVVRKVFDHLQLNGDRGSREGRKDKKTISECVITKSAHGVISNRCYVIMFSLSDQKRDETATLKPTQIYSGAPLMNRQGGGV